MKSACLIAAGMAFLLLPAESVFAQAKSLRWPTTADLNRINYGFDNDPLSGQSKDWRCSSKVYDAHRGHDIGVRRGSDILAAATGWVQRRADGFGDGFVGSNDGNGFGNHVALYHDKGGYNTIYGHMTSGSGIPAAGDTIGCGERLGGGGTSGNSSGVHLHFEIRLNVDRTNYYSGKEVDPFTGPCSTPVSYWTDQGDDKPSTLCSSPVTMPAGNREPLEAFATRSFPNPFLAAATIEFGVPSSPEEADPFVALTIHDANGMLIERPIHGRLPTGTHSHTLRGEGLSPGIYFYRIVIGEGFRKTVKMVKAR